MKPFKIIKDIQKISAEAGTFLTCLLNYALKLFHSGIFLYLKMITFKESHFREPFAIDQFAQEPLFLLQRILESFRAEAGSKVLLGLLDCRYLWGHGLG